MAIKKIRVSNFKSFKDLEVELGQFNVVIGANASGKSNFVEIFRFLRDIVTEGLDNAVSLQGGAEYLRNINIGSDNFSLEVVLDSKYGMITPYTESGAIRLGRYEDIYSLAIKFKKRGRGSRFKIAEEKFIQRFDNLESRSYNDKSEGGELTREITISNIGGKIDIYPKDASRRIKRLYQFLRLRHARSIVHKSFSNDVLLPRLPVIEFSLGELRGISIYYFDPKLSKKATPITGKAELEEDGRNLAIVLKNILEDNEKKRRFSNLVNSLLLFVEKLGVEKSTDKSLFFKLKETYAKKYLPASLLSDGTINIIALIIALYFERKPLIIIEEPERNIHPYLISKVVKMMKDASRNKQIIVTTHSPEIVKYAGLENILLISRDKEGFSAISKPKDKEEVKIFLQNELGIEELYVQNLLE